METTQQTILIVDDEASIRLTLGEVLRSKGYVVDAVADGDAALARVAAQPPALVLLDLRLPGMDGMEVLRELARRHPEIPVLVATAHGNVDTALDAMEIGAAGFLEKPFTPEHLRRVVARALSREQQAAETAESYEQHLREGVACLEERHLDAALGHARRALSLDPTRPEAFNLIGVLKQLRGQLREAQRYYRSALALQPGFEPAQQNQENLARPPHERRMSSYRLE